MYKFLCGCMFPIPLGYISMSKMAQSHSKSMFNYLGNVRSIVPKQLPHFTFLPATYEGSIASHLHQYLIDF